MSTSTPKIDICKACQQEVSELRFGYCSVCDEDMAKADLHLAIRDHIPQDWRIGQFIFNFLQWLGLSGDSPIATGERMADPFHLEDGEFIKYWFEYLKDLKKIIDP